MFNNIGIAKKIYTGFGIVLVLLALNAALSIFL